MSIFELKYAPMFLAVSFATIFTASYCDLIDGNFLQICLASQYLECGLSDI